MNRLEGIVAPSRAFPPDAVLGRQTGAAGHQRHPLGDDEGRIEADAELADQLGIFCLVTGQLLKKLLRSRLGNRTDVLDVPRPTISLDSLLRAGE